MSNIQTAMTHALLSENKSFLVIVLVAILGWSLTRLVDTVTSGPALEYSVNILKSDESSHKPRMLITLENLSREETITDIRVYVTIDGDAKPIPGSCDIQLQQPNYTPGSNIAIDAATEGNNNSNTKYTQCWESDTQDQKFIQFGIRSLFPGTAANLEASLSRAVDNKNITMMLQANTNIQGLRPISKGYITYIVKHESQILLAVIVGSLLIIILSILYVASRQIQLTRQTNATQAGKE
jgi:hypothetical protein